MSAVFWPLHITAGNKREYFKWLETDIGVIYGNYEILHGSYYLSAA
jgi:hypothetical protein